MLTKDTMNVPCRLLAIDVDGTLVDRQNRLPQANRIAIHRAHEAGVKVCLCTGRSLTEARPVLDEIDLDLDAGMFVFGAVVSDLKRGETIFRSPLSTSLAHRLVDFFARHDYPSLCVYDTQQVGFDYHYVEGYRNRKAYEDWIRQTPCLVKRIERQTTTFDIVPPLRVGAIVEHEAGNKIVSSLKNTFSPSELKFNLIFVAQYDFYVLECFSPEVNKWYGISQLIDLWNIDASQVAAIGDDVNDVEMLAHAGVGIAMGNASDEVKAAADWHAPTNDACGLAWAIDALLNDRNPQS